VCLPMVVGAMVDWVPMHPPPGAAPWVPMHRCPAKANAKAEAKDKAE